jgi:hypothetical protein
MQRMLPRWLVTGPARSGRSAGPAASSGASSGGGSSSGGGGGGGGSGAGSSSGAAAAWRWAVPAALGAAGLYITWRVGRGLYVFFTADPAAGIEHSCIPTDEDEWDHRCDAGLCPHGRRHGARMGRLHGRPHGRPHGGTPRRSGRARPCSLAGGCLAANTRAHACTPSPPLTRMRPSSPPPRPPQAAAAGADARPAAPAGRARRARAARRERLAAGGPPGGLGCRDAVRRRARGLPARGGRAAGGGGRGRRRPARRRLGRRRPAGAAAGQRRRRVVRRRGDAAGGGADRDEPRLQKIGRGGGAGGAGAGACAADVAPSGCQGVTQVDSEGRRGRLAARSSSPPTPAPTPRGPLLHLPACPSCCAPTCCSWSWTPPGRR